MSIEYLLQQYEDGTFGYYLIDGDKHCNYKTESKVVCMQGEDEDRNEFITKNGITFISNQYGSDLKLDIQINYGDYRVRVEVARQGYGLEKLINDKDYDVRIAVAEQGYGLDKLVKDKDFCVRREVARQGYGLDILVNDEDLFIRKVVARKGYRLDKLVNDEHCLVRKEVAKQGYGLEKLINDEDKEVRREVAHYLNNKADDNFIIDLGNKLIDKGYKLSTNNIKLIFTDETYTKFKEFRTYKEYELIYQVLARLL